MVGIKIEINTPDWREIVKDLKDTIWMLERRLNPSCDRVKLSGGERKVEYYA